MHYYTLYCRVDKNDDIDSKYKTLHVLTLHTKIMLFNILIIISSFDRVFGGKFPKIILSVLRTQILGLRGFLVGHD